MLFLEKPMIDFGSDIYAKEEGDGNPMYIDKYRRLRIEHSKYIIGEGGFDFK